MGSLIQWRRDTAANWTSVNPTLAQGEPAYETDTLLFKIGDGSTAWNDLDYAGLRGEDGLDGAQGATGGDNVDGGTPSSVPIPSFVIDGGTV